MLLSQVHTVRGTGILQQFVDKQQLPREMGGDFNHSHDDWLTFRMVRNYLASCLVLQGICHGSHYSLF